jgi:hypothetical protein
MAPSEAIVRFTNAWELVVAKTLGVLMERAFRHGIFDRAAV